MPESERNRGYPHVPTGGSLHLRPSLRRLQVSTFPRQPRARLCPYRPLRSGPRFFPAMNSSAAKTVYWRFFTRDFVPDISHGPWTNSPAWNVFVDTSCCWSSDTCQLRQSNRSYRPSRSMASRREFLYFRTHGRPPTTTFARSIIFVVPSILPVACPIIVTPG